MALWFCFSKPWEAWFSAHTFLWKVFSPVLLGGRKRGSGIERNGPDVGNWTLTEVIRGHGSPIGWTRGRPCLERNHTLCCSPNYEHNRLPPFFVYLCLDGSYAPCPCLSVHARDWLSFFLCCPLCFETLTWTWSSLNLLDHLSVSTAGIIKQATVLGSCVGAGTWAQVPCACKPSTLTAEPHPQFP